LQAHIHLPGAVLGKNIGGGGAGPSSFGIWEVTTSRTAVYNCPVLSNLCTVITLKMCGPGQDLGGGVPPWPQHRTTTAIYRHFSKLSTLHAAVFTATV